MKSASKHPNEQSRLEALKSLNILDSIPEKDFDEITAIAAQICGVPISLISLVDDERQWFKSRHGIDVSEMPRSIAFCAHAILQDDVFIVEDATKDDRFFDNPLVSGGSQIRFYAGAPLLSPDGYPIGTVCVIDTKSKLLSESQKVALKGLSNQVTRLLELKIQIKKLKASEEKLLFKNTAAENISEGLLLQDSSGLILDYNTSALRLLNFSSDVLTHKTFQELCATHIRQDGSELPPLEQPAFMCLRTGKKQSNTIVGVQISSEDIRWLNVNSVPLFLGGDSTPTHVVSSFADITDQLSFQKQRQKLELQLAESARLSSLGEMAGGVAHEINNPLAIIRGKASLIKRQIENNELNLEKSLKDIESIENTVDRIAKIIKGLRSYARKVEDDPFEVANINMILDETLDICKERLRKDAINLELTCDRTLHAECRSAQISQIILNLLTNSCDAIAALPEKWIRIHVECQSDFVKIIFQDSGHGIDFQVARKIMQPFFTTKPIGKGTGLGLSISSGIAATHNGELIYDSTNPNTTFVLTLPIMQNLLTEQVA